MTEVQASARAAGLSARLEEGCPTGRLRRQGALVRGTHGNRAVQDAHSFDTPRKTRPRKWPVTVRRIL